MQNPASSRSLPRVVTAVALATDGDGAPRLPTRMRILKWGDNPNSQGVPVRVGPRLVAAMREPTYPFRQIALDYEHNTWPGSKAYQETREPREVAAFLTVEAVEGKGVFVKVDRWTPSGLLQAHNYCDLSATPLLDAHGNVTAIVSVALSRAGSVPEIAFAQAAAMSAGSNPQANNGDEDRMNWKEIVAKALGLAADCTDEDLKAAWEAFLDGAKKPAESKPAEAALSANIIGEIVATAVKAHTAALSARIDGQDKQKLIGDARSEGKVVALADTLLARMTTEELRSHIKELPVVVPLAALTPTHLKDGQAVVTLSATEQQVCRALGLSAEAYAKEKAVA